MNDRLFEAALVLLRRHPEMSYEDAAYRACQFVKTCERRFAIEASHDAAVESAEGEQTVGSWTIVTAGTGEARKATEAESAALERYLHNEDWWYSIKDARYKRDLAMSIPEVRALVEAADHPDLEPRHNYEMGNPGENCFRGCPACALSEAVAPFRGGPDAES